MGKIVYSGPGFYQPSEQRWRRIEELQFRMNQVSEYMFMRGLNDEELRAMPQYDRSLVWRIAGDRAQRENDLIELIKAVPIEKSQLREIIVQRTLILEIGDKLPALLSRANFSMDSFFCKGKEWITEFLDDLPSLAVQMALTIQTDLNANRPWTRNDIHDMDAMSGGVPYCDTVVTEKYANEVMNKSGLAKRYGTTVIRTLGKLEPILERILEGGGIARG